MTITELIESIKNYNPTPKPIQVAAWGQSLHIKALTTSDWAAIRAKGANDVHVVIAGVCDENGNRVFADNHEALLSASPAGVIMDLSHEILKLSGIIKDADAKN